MVMGVAFCFRFAGTAFIWERDDLHHIFSFSVFQNETVSAFGSKCFLYDQKLDSAQHQLLLCPTLDSYVYKFVQFVCEGRFSFQASPEKGEIAYGIQCAPLHSAADALDHVRMRMLECVWEDESSYCAGPFPVRLGLVFLSLDDTDMLHQHDGENSLPTLTLSSACLEQSPDLG
eukprot:gb/GECG01004549.1/.p1 GENE.gb/GECG01004549.1/~~gb/GECG01004549.1/.p1  ORF type:complete len:174 (+),score=9.08 gb/GECG01004549.1/:1-522(+)